MPTSVSSQISPVIEVVMWKKPKKVLDVGIGYGKYGLLVREYLDNKVERLDGVEVFEPYITNIQRAIYDNIYITDIRDFEPPVEYDLILLADVIEHMTKEEGIALLKRLPGNKIVATPNGFIEQEASNGNVHERHLSGWTMEDFMENFPNSQQLKYFMQLIVLIPE